MATQPKARLAEVVASLSLTTDLAIAFRADMFPLDMANPLVSARYFGRTVGRGDSPIRRAAKLIGPTTQSKAICRDVAMRVGGSLDLHTARPEWLAETVTDWLRQRLGAVLPS